MIRHVCRCRHCGAIEIEGLEVDPHRSAVHWQGAIYRVPPGQMRLLERLLRADGRSVSTAQAEHAIWGHRPDGGPVTADNVVKVYVSRLRATLREIGAPVRIVSQWGQGYAIERVDSRVEVIPVKARRAMVDG
jgi:DNA-binding response OmpR family regulator